MEVRDFCGPFEVFTVANRFTDPPTFHVFSVADMGWRPGWQGKDRKAAPCADLTIPLTEMHTPGDQFGSHPHGKRCL